MKNRLIGAAVVLGVSTLLVVSTSHNTALNTSLNYQPSTSGTAKKSKPLPIPTCDGTSVTSNCGIDGLHYKTYVYHPAVPERSHNEQITTYQQQVVGYCTLCIDGTYSPSCATGRGACSHHGGVSEWNAPEYSNVPVYSTKTVIDAPAQDAYYDKVAE